jgi:rubrerythrin
MSRLAQRVTELEQRLGACPDCRHPTIELRYNGAPASAAEPPQICPSCREPVERIQILLAFDPDLGGDQ